jgi:hypothetical protein
MKYAMLVLLLAAATVSSVALNSEWRLRFQAWAWPNEKKLLATVSGDLLGDGSNYKILKYATHQGLILEVQMPSKDPDQDFSLVDRVYIPDRFDGFFSINTIATRLALVDVDNDGRLEIVAPSFDDKLVAHLNTLRLNQDTRRLEIVKPLKTP